MLTAGHVWAVSPACQKVIETQRPTWLLCMTVYKCLHGLAPKYLAELCVPFRLWMLPGAVNYVLLAEDF